MSEEIHVKFANLEEARELLGAHDEYVSRLSRFDCSAKLQVCNPRTEVTRDEYCEHAAKQALHWDSEEKIMIIEALRSIEQNLVLFPLPLPNIVTFVLTSGEEEAGAAYTRGQAVFLSKSILHGHLNLPKLLAHELVHIASRIEPTWREAINLAIGFHSCPEPEFPEGFRSRMIANPDAPFLDHCILVTHKGNLKWGMPVIYSLYPYRGGSFFRYITVGFVFLNRSVDASSDTPSILEEPLNAAPIDELEGFYEQIGRNTTYIMHPEETLADNIAFLLIGKEDLPSPEISSKLADVINDFSPQRYSNGVHFSQL